MGSSPGEMKGRIYGSIGAGTYSISKKVILDVILVSRSLKS